MSIASSPASFGSFSKREDTLDSRPLYHASPCQSGAGPTHWLLPIWEQLDRYPNSLTQTPKATRLLEVLLPNPGAGAGGDAWRIRCLAELTSIIASDRIDSQSSETRAGTRAAQNAALSGSLHCQCQALSCERPTLAKTLAGYGGCALTQSTPQLASSHAPPPLPPPIPQLRRPEGLASLHKGLCSHCDQKRGLISSLSRDVVCFRQALKGKFSSFNSSDGSFYSNLLQQEF